MIGRDARRHWLAGTALLVIGAGIAAAGSVLLERSWRTVGLVATAQRVRNGEVSLPSPELNAVIRDLEQATRSGPSADEAAALTSLHYAAAAAAAERRDFVTWTDELIAARAAARKTLSLAPTRADVSLDFAEIEFLLGGPGKAVDAALNLSFLTAPHELWIIERRIGLELRLVPTATPDMRAHIAEDIRTMGQPFRDTRLYRELARAAFQAGPAAIAMVRGELAAVHEQPLQLFDSYLAEMKAAAAQSPR